LIRYIGGPSAQPIPLQAVAAGAGVPLQATAVGAAIPPTPAIMQQGSRATQAGGGLVQDRVEVQLKWIEKLLFVCIFLALYAIMKKNRRCLSMCLCQCILSMCLYA
jgi:hypothetical protein